jgi:hypothetical protein
MLNTQLPRFNARWRDPLCEEIDCSPPRKHKLQPSEDCSPNPRCQTAPLMRSRHRRGPLLAQQIVVPRPPPPRIPHLAFPASAGPFLPRQARRARGGRTTLLERGGLSSTTLSWLYTRHGATCQSLRAAQGVSTEPPPAALRPAPGTQRYHLAANPTQASWSPSMTTHFRTLLGTDKWGTTAIGLLSNSLVPSIYANYDSTLRHYFAFCAEENLPPLQATPATMLRYRLARPTRYGGCWLHATLLFRGEQALPRPPTTTHRRW